MKISSTAKKILYILAEKGIGPSGFINEYKKSNGDIENTLHYFLKYKNLKLKYDSDKKNSVSLKQGPASYRKIIDVILKGKTGLLEISSAGYPALLKQIYIPPPLLFFKGDKIINLKSGIAIVGSRKCTAYGRDAATYLSRNLSKMGITIVSGFAAGIDSHVHKAAIKEKGGTIAVLGCGIDIIYPPENKYLYKEILKNGSIITEFMPGTPPLKSNFPVRNRIISGLCMGVVVVEAGEKSGAMITCREALKQNREVMAVPGSIFNPVNKGCHLLIKEGAKPVEDIDDILEEFSQFNGKMLNPEKTFLASRKRDREKKCNVKLSGDEKRIYEYIGFRSRSIEEIVKYSGMEVKDILKIVAYLEMNNLIREDSINKYVRIF